MAMPTTIETTPTGSHEALGAPETIRRGASLEILDSVPASQEQQRTLDEYRALRTQFVLEMNWFTEDELPAGGDSDFYDQLNNPDAPNVPDPEKWHTSTIVGRDEKDGEIIAGARFTRIPSVERSLSWSMLSQEMKDQVPPEALDELNEVADSGDLYDLTRLVNQLDGSAHQASIVMAMLKIFGAGVAKTCEGSKNVEDVTWVYTTTPEMHELLAGLGVQQDLLAKADIPDATGKPEGVLFCSVKVMESLRNIQSNPDNAFAAKHIERGLREAQAQ